MRSDDPVEPEREVERAITVLLRRLSQPPYYVVLTVNPATEDPAAAAESKQCSSFIPKGTFRLSATLTAISS